MLKYGILFPEIPEEAYIYRKKKYTEEEHIASAYSITETVKFQYTELIQNEYKKYVKEYIEEGNNKNIASDIRPIMGYFIYEIIKKNGFKKVFQNGIKNGIDSLYILEALKGKKDFSLDIFNDNLFEWKGKGEKLIRSEPSLDKFKKNIKVYAGNITKFIEANKDTKYDLIYMNSSHLTDKLMMNFYLANKMLNVGGLVIWVIGLGHTYIVSDYVRKKYNNWKLIEFNENIYGEKYSNLTRMMFFVKLGEDKRD
jgi:hypothetical protein